MNFISLDDDFAAHVRSLSLPQLITAAVASSKADQLHETEAYLKRALMPCAIRPSYAVNRLRQQ